MSENNNQPLQSPETQSANVPLNNLDSFASGVWNEGVAQQPTPTTQEPPTPDPLMQEPSAATPPATEPEKIINSDEWVKQFYGWENAEAGKKELEELRKLRETAQTPAEIKFANEQSQKYYEAITGGKTDDLYNILHQQKQLERLEKLTLANTGEAAEIIKANLQFKHADLTPNEINFLYNKRYAIPSKPTQGVEQSDEDYAIQVAGWQDQVKEKEQEIIIEAKLAKPELSKYKSDLVLPDIPKVFPDENSAVSQEELAAQEAFRNNFTQQLKTDTKFKGFNVTAKDGEVELPISYVVSDEEKAGFNDVVQRAVTNLNDFLDNELGWWDKEAKTFNVSKMQEDLYLLKNREKVHQKIANEAAAKRYEHQLKIQNNIKLNTVTNQPVLQPSTKQAMDELASFAFQS